MEKTKSVYCDEGDDHESSLDQKLEYLEKLFVAIDKEQSDLLSYLLQQKNNENNNTDGNSNIDNNNDNNNGKSSCGETFIQNINEAEVNIRVGYTLLQSGEYSGACDQYDASLQLISPYVDHTTLLDPLLIEIRTKRGQCNCKMDKVDECLVDTTFLLEQERLGLGESSAAPTVSVTILKLHSEALMKVGRSEEARESMGKLAILCPEDEEVVKMMQDFGLK